MTRNSTDEWKKPIKLDVPVAKDGHSEYKGITGDEFISFLEDEEGLFDIISVPVYCPRWYINNDKDSKGEIIVGYVDTYSIEDKTFTISIFPRYTDVINDSTICMIAANAVYEKQKGTSKITKIKIAF